MAKSKAARSAKQLQRAEDLDATDALDADFAALVSQGGLEGLVRPLMPMGMLGGLGFRIQGPGRWMQSLPRLARRSGGPGAAP